MPKAVPIIQGSQDGERGTREGPESWFTPKTSQNKTPKVLSRQKAELVGNMSPLPSVQGNEGEKERVRSLRAIEEGTQSQERGGAV